MTHVRLKISKEDLLQLKYEKLRGFDEDWEILTRNFFDLEMMAEPHQSFSLLVNRRHSQYIFRILGTTRFVLKCYKVCGLDITSNVKRERLLQQQ